MRLGGEGRKAVYKRFFLSCFLYVWKGARHGGIITDLHLLSHMYCTSAPIVSNISLLLAIYTHKSKTPFL